MNRNKKFKIIGLSIGIFLLGFFVFTGTSYALDNLDDQIDELGDDLEGINEEMEAQEGIIDELGDKIDKYQDNIKQKHNEKISLNNQVNILESDIEMNEAEIGKKAAEIELLKLEIQELKLEIDDTNQEVKKNKVLISSYIYELYQYEQKSYLELIFQFNSLSEYSAQAEYVKNLRSEFQEILDDVQELEKELAEKKKEQTDKKDLLKDEKGNLEIERASLNTEVDYKNNLIDLVKNDEGKFQELVSQIEEEVAQVNDEIYSLDKDYSEKFEELKNKEEENKQKETEDEVLEEEVIEEEIEEESIDLPDAFNPSWPATGIITAYYHDPTYPYDSIFKHPGIDIAVSQGTPIMAADSGYVAIAKFNGTFEYSYVVLAHVEDYKTLYGHLSSMVVSPDQYVEQGELIGYSGGEPETPGAGRYSTGAHLHFEIRFNDFAVDPLPYLP